MWLRAMIKLRRALRRYRNDRDLEAVLLRDWEREPVLGAFFSDIEERLHGEEIARLRQKQSEYLALQNQINPHFLYNALEAIRTDALLADCGEIAETTEALSHSATSWTMRRTISPFSGAASGTSYPWSWIWRMKSCWRRGCRS